MQRRFTGSRDTPEFCQTTQAYLVNLRCISTTDLLLLLVPKINQPAGGQLSPSKRGQNSAVVDNLCCACSCKRDAATPSDRAACSTESS
jgi:hypothetical protein